MLSGVLGSVGFRSSMVVVVEEDVEGEVEEARLWQGLRRGYPQCSHVTLSGCQ